MQFIDNYEHAVASEARRRGVDGVVCGPSITPRSRTIDGVLYCNDGDWVESCTRPWSRISKGACASSTGPRNMRAAGAQLPRLAPAQMAAE